MPPRNSNTKAFKKYNYIKSPNAKIIPIETIYGNILKPENSINNEYYKSLEAYKKKMSDDGIDIQKRIQKLFKDDDDGDERYINTDWYKRKLEGDKWVIVSYLTNIYSM